MIVNGIVSVENTEHSMYTALQVSRVCKTPQHICLGALVQSRAQSGVDPRANAGTSWRHTSSLS